MTGETSLEAVAGWINRARRIVALTGAGISTESGIPDYRGPQGVWTLDPEAAKLVTLDAYVQDKDVRRRAWLSRRDHPAWMAEPSAGHRALYRLDRGGALLAVITQNVDGLHQRAGHGPGQVIEVHGTIFEVECLHCGDRTRMREALDRVAAGEDDPDCRVCGGILKSATISFGQSLDMGTFQRAVTCVAAADLLIAIGTSLQVYPVAGLVDVARTAGARIVIVNAEPTPYDDIADAVLREPIGEVLPALVS